VGALSVERGEMMSGTGQVARAKSKGGTASEAEAMDLSRSRSWLRWMLAVRDSLPTLILVLILSLSLRVEPPSVLTSFPSGSYTRLPLSLVLKLLCSRWWRRSLLMWTVSPVLSLRAGLSPVLLAGSLWETCACSDFLIALASPFLTVEISAFSFARRLWLFGLISVASDRSGDAAAVGEGGGGGSSYA